jgi:hypothetical protein
LSENTNRKGGGAIKKEASVFLLLIVLSIANSIRSMEQDAFKIIKNEGIPIAVNPDHPVPAKNSPQDILFQEDLTLGAIEGDPHLVFGPFIRFAVDDQASIYVLDCRSQAVRKFDKSGAYLLSFGKPGQGPGEFNDPQEIRFLRSKDLIIFEGESQKFSVFKHNGNFLKSGRFFKLMFAPYFGFSNGNFIATNIQYEAHKKTIATAVYNEKSELLVLLHQSESKPEAPWPSRDDQEGRAKRLAEVLSQAAFQRTSVIALDREEGIYFGFSDKYEIKIYSAEAKLRRVITTALPLLPVSKKDRQDFLDIWVPKDITTWSTMSGPMKKKILDSIKFVEKKPAFLEIIPMDDNFLMVLREGQFNQKALVDIFDPQGRFIIEKRLPFPLKEAICREGKLYSLFEDNQGYQFVRRYDYKFQ